MRIVNGKNMSQSIRNNFPSLTISYMIYTSINFLYVSYFCSFTLSFDKKIIPVKENISFTKKLFIFHSYNKSNKLHEIIKIGIQERQ